jgi:probable phosphoglycerate mutase
MEWDYGDFEGRRTADIQKERPGWSLWRDGVPNGETIEQVSARAKRVLRRVSALDGDVALFSHGHLLRILAALWLGLSPTAGKLFALGTGSISVIGFEHDQRVVERWNDSHHLAVVKRS